MYQLRVYYPGEEGARTTLTAHQGIVVRNLIAELLSEHPSCERISFKLDSQPPFDVDRLGNRLA